jgi:hypothetical protein
MRAISCAILVPLCTIQTYANCFIKGMCEKVLNIDLQAFEVSEFPSLVIRDLQQSVEHSNRSYIRESDVRFYAGAPLISPNGAIVGSLCVLDDKPRPDGLPQEHRHSLRDIAQSIMDYLHTYTIKDQLWRGERFTRGLISFSEGAEALLPFKNARQREAESPQGHGMSSQALASPHDERCDPLSALPQPSTSGTSKTSNASNTSNAPSRPTIVRINSNQQRSMKKLQNTILPTDARTMFSRAANVMMASSDLDGVVILDASVAANKTRRRSRSGDSYSAGTTGTEEAGDSFPSPSSSSDGSSPTRGRSRGGSSSKTSEVLGSATRAPDSREKGAKSTFASLLESDLSRMLHDYPNGKIITFGMDGLPLSSTDDSAISSSSSKNSLHGSQKRKSTKSRTSRITRAVQAMLPGARSVAFVPFWDFERSRWFAGCLCWSNRTHRLLSAAIDLPYFKVFSHSIMRELSRLDALALNHLKTTFVASISHELRSPLHGILGTLEFIKDTQLDSFQISMFNSLNACGQTLLDTIK